MTQLTIKTEPVYVIQRTPAGVACTVDGKALDPRLDLWNHSPTGFECGYGGSGPAQLALAILAHCCGDDLAVKYHQAFKWAVVGALPREGGTLTAHFVRSVLSQLQAERENER